MTSPPRDVLTAAARDRAREIAAALPPLTDEQRVQLRLLLRPGRAEDPPTRRSRAA